MSSCMGARVACTGVRAPYSKVHCRPKSKICALCKRTRSVISKPTSVLQPKGTPLLYILKDDRSVDCRDRVWNHNVDPSGKGTL